MVLLVPIAIVEPHAEGPWAFSISRVDLFGGDFVRNGIFIHAPISR